MTCAGRAVLALVAMALVAGCGGDDDERLSKAELIERADAVCAEYTTRFDAVAVPEGDPTAPDAPQELLRQAAQAGPAIASIERDQVRELRALEPPEDFEARWDTVLDDLTARAAGLDEVGQAAERGDRKTLARSFAAADQAGTRANRAVQSYGFRTCGSGA